MPRYRRIPIIVKAEQLTEDHVPEGVVNKFGTYYINTHGGELCVSLGNYIITDTKGELYPCDPDIFEMTYELVG